MFRFRRRQEAAPLMCSELYTEQTFYAAFLRDVKRARKLVVIESPFITRRRFNSLYPALRSAVRRGVQIVVNTRDPACHDEPMCQQAADCIVALHDIGATVLYTGNLHRKLIMVDAEILWEGSLNLFSQNDSCEVMRRTLSEELVVQMIRFTRLDKWYNV